MKQSFSSAIEPRWTSSAKSGVGTAISDSSPLWFTLSHGIVNEVYYPRLDQANIRDLGFIVTDGCDFVSEEKRDTDPVIESIEPGIPGYKLQNTCKAGRYRINKTIFSDPRRPCLVQEISFEAMEGKLAEYKLFALLAPHLENHGAENEGWLGDYKGWPMLFARRGDTTLALSCSSRFLGSSCAIVGENDGWQDLKENKQLTNTCARIDSGNLALTSEIDLASCDGKLVVVLAFGGSPAEAGQRARATLLEPPSKLMDKYVAGWREYQSRCLSHSNSNSDPDKFYRTSIAVMRTHLSKHFVGGMTASLSIPWGFSKGDNDLGGYHLVWPRDQVESAGALLASGDEEGARDILRYLLSTQEFDGRWAQNLWLDGTPYWDGVQLDETAFPILLADALSRGKALDGLDVWDAIRRAAEFLILNGPSSQQDRWEEDSGYSPFTLAVVISGLLAAADFADAADEKKMALYLRETADLWNECIEEWTYVDGSILAKQFGVSGHYVRIAPPEKNGLKLSDRSMITIKNREASVSLTAAAKLVSPDALTLVRFGLRAADDEKILNTIQVIDGMLKSETKNGPVWHRYNGDGYGEHEDGSPFDGTGIGRGWPLLTGERAHYELAAGRPEEAQRLMKIMENQSGPGHFFPEQVWDSPDIPERELFNGKPSGSAMPLVWAHAEYIKLVRSIRDGKIFDTPPQPSLRYIVAKTTSPVRGWRFSRKIQTIPQGKNLRIELLTPAVIHWTADEWKTSTNIQTLGPGLGIHYADLNITGVPSDTDIAFTFRWIESGNWEGHNFLVTVE